MKNTDNTDKPEYVSYRSPRIKRPAKSGRLRFVKLSVSAGIMLFVLLIKLLDPNGASRLSAAVDEYVGGDSSAFTIEALGRAISEGVSAVFAPVSPSPSPSPDVSPSAEEPAAEGTSVDRAYDLNSRSQLWRATPSPSPEVFSEDELLLDEYGIDDTLPLPYGMSAPASVDFTRYELSFAYGSPVEGVKSSGFGYRMHPIKKETLFHYGTDFSANRGTAITAFADGTVSASGVSGTYGNYLIISHPDGISSLYAHCDKVLVKAGKTVKLGEKIATVGSTGLSTGPHLHFELRRGDTILDPEYYAY